MTTHSVPLLADTERNGPDTNHQVRRDGSAGGWGGGGGEGGEGSRGELCGGGQGVRSCFISLFPSPTPTHSLQNPQNKTSPFSVSPTGPSTKVSTCQGSQGRGRGVLRWAGFGIWERVPDACRGPRAWYTSVTGLLPPPLLTLGLPPQACDSPGLLPLPWGSGGGQGNPPQSPRAMNNRKLRAPHPSQRP